MTKQHNMLENISCGLALLLPCPFSHYRAFIRLFHTGFVIRELPAPAQWKGRHLTSLTSEEIGHTIALLFFSFSVNYCLGKCLCRGVMLWQWGWPFGHKMSALHCFYADILRTFHHNKHLPFESQNQIFHAFQVHLQSYSHMVTSNSSFKTHICLETNVNELCKLNFALMFKNTKLPTAKRSRRR